MNGWHVPIAITVVLYGVGTLFLAKANPIHGAKMSVFLQWAGYALLLLLLRFGRADFAQVTKSSLWFGAGAAFCFVVGTYYFFHALGIVGPRHVAIVDAVAASYFIITAILVQIFVRPQTLQEWVGIVLILGGVVVLCLFPGE